MGEVWRTHDTATDRVVALNLLAKELAADEDFVRRFRREAHAVSQLNNAHVTPIPIYGEIADQLYINMHLIEGGNLREALAGGP